MTSLHSSPSPTDEVVIRRAGEADAAAIERLSRLDSQRPLQGAALVAERDGHVLAALALEDGRVVADPFRCTADLVALLHLRAGALASGRAAAGGRRRLTRWRPAFSRG